VGVRKAVGRVERRNEQGAGRFGMMLTG